MTMLSFLLACSSPATLPTDSADGIVDGTDTGGDGSTTDPIVPDAIGPEWDADHLLLVSSQDTVEAYAAGGGSSVRWSLADLVDDRKCAGGDCYAEGMLADGEGLVFSWAYQSSASTGGLLRLDPGGDDLTPTWMMPGWEYPHEAVRDPDGAAYIVADAFLDALRWVPDDGSGDASAPLYEIDGNDSEAAGGHTPNGMVVVREDGFTGLLVSYRGNDASSPGSGDGKLVMWDISGDGAVLAWSFPAEGTLATPHDPSLHWRDGHWLLTYAHTLGDGGNGGTVGLAELPDLRTAPTYLADLRPTSVSWPFPRGVLLAGTDTLYVTDSMGDGPGNRAEGGVYRLALPDDLVATGKSGAASSEGTDQTFIDIADITPVVTGLQNAYRSMLWAPTW